MKPAAIPPDDDWRVAMLRRYEILDTEPESEFDDAAALAAAICQTPIAIVGLIDGHRQWYKAKVGLTNSEVPREETFCGHALLDKKVLEVPDATRDPRFHDYPAVKGDPYVRFYAGAPLLDASGAALGTLCVIDHKPRDLSDVQRAALEALARLVVAHMRLRIANRTLARAAQDVDQPKREQHEQDLLNQVSHDLRTPMTPMLMHLRILREGATSETALHSITVLERNLLRLNDAVTQTLAFTATMQGRKP